MPASTIAPPSSTSASTTAEQFVEHLWNDPILAASFAYCIIGGIGPCHVDAIFLKCKFDQLAPWDRAAVVFAVRDIVTSDLTAAFDAQVRGARAADDEKAAAAAKAITRTADVVSSG